MPRPWRCATARDSAFEPRCAATTVKYSDAPVGYTCEMWHSTRAAVPDSDSAVVSASVTAAFSAAMLDQFVAVSRVSHSAPAASSASRRYGAPNRPCSHARAGASPSDVPPWATSTARVSACRLSVCAAVPSNTVIARQPPAICLFADVLGGGEVDAGLGLVGQSDDGGAGAGLGDGRAVRRRRSRSRGTTTPRSAVDSGTGCTRSAHRRDDAEHALGPNEQLAQVGTRGRRRGATEVEHARRGDHPKSADHVVDAAVACRVLA